MLSCYYEITKKGGDTVKVVDNKSIVHAVPAVNVLLKGWVVFSEYCKIKDIAQNGYHLKRLNDLDDKFKVNITPTSKRPLYAVYEDEADKIFL